MLKAYKYRIYPNKEQINLFFQFFGCTRFIYNKCIEWYSNAYKLYKLNGTDVSNEEELATDMISLLASFSGKLYGKRSAERRKKNKIDKN